METVSDPLLASEGFERVRHSISKVLAIALPTIAARLLSFVNESTNTVFIGRSGVEVMLAAVGVGNMMQNCIGIATGNGFSNALNTFSSQAAGARKPELSAVYLQRCRLLSSMQLFWIVPILWLSERILHVLHQDASVAYHASSYNKITAFGLFFFFQGEAFQAFLRSYGYVNFPAAISLLVSFLHVGWCWFFIWHLELGNFGAGLANCLAWFTRSTVLACYAGLIAPNIGLTRWEVLGIQADAFHGWYEYLALAVPMFLQSWFMWCYWGTILMMVGTFGVVPLSAHTATTAAISIMFMVPHGFKTAAAALVAKYLGANEPDTASLIWRTSMGVNFVVWMVLSLGLFLSRHHIAAAYTPEANVCRIIERLFSIYLISGIFESTQALLAGVLAGMARARVVSAVYFVVYYMISIPVAYLLATTWQLGVDGVWYATIPGNVFAAAVFGFLLLTTDWHTESRAALERMKQRIEISTCSSEAEQSSD